MAMIERREDLARGIFCEWMLFELRTPDGQTLQIGSGRSTIPYFSGCELAEAFITASGLSPLGLSVASRESRELVDKILSGLTSKLSYAMNPASDKHVEILNASQFLRAIVCLAAQQDLVYFLNPIEG
jgi:hypothetical protein